MSVIINMLQCAAPGERAHEVSQVTECAAGTGLSQVQRGECTNGLLNIVSARASCM